MSTKENFRRVLLSFGFKQLKSYRKGITPYEHEEEGIYCELYRDEHPYVWAIGGDLRDSRSYPGGFAYWKPEELRSELIEKKVQEG